LERHCERRQESLLCAQGMKGTTYSRTIRSLISERQLLQTKVTEILEFRIKQALRE
jgi:hypothetical protein